MQDFTLKHHQANVSKKLKLNNKVSQKNRVNGYLYFFFINIYFLNSPRTAVSGILTPHSTPTQKLVFVRTCL